MATSYQSSITNDDVIKCMRASPMSQVVGWLLEQNPEASIVALIKKVKKVDDKFKKLRKNKHREAGKLEMDNFLQENYSVTAEGEIARLYTPSGREDLENTHTSQLRSKEARIKELDEQVQKMKVELESKDRLIGALEERVEDKNVKLHRHRESDRYYRIQYAKLEQLTGKQQEEDLQESTETDEIETMRKELIEMDYRFDVLNEEVRVTQ